MIRSTLLRHTGTGLIVLTAAATTVVGLGAMHGDQRAEAPVLPTETAVDAAPAVATASDVNPWAAGDAAITQYLADLGRRCSASAVHESADPTTLVARGRQCFLEGRR